MPKNDPFVKMEHPAVKGTGTARKSSFDKVWSKKGWKLVADKKETSTSSTPPTSPTPPSS